MKLIFEIVDIVFNKRSDFLSVIADAIELYHIIMFMVGQFSYKLEFHNVSSTSTVRNVRIFF